MKKITIILSMLVASFAGANAQTGSYLLFGGIDGASSSGTTPFSINAGFGYQFNESLTAGLLLDYQNDDYATITTSMTPNFLVGPFIRQTKSLSSLFSFYNQIGLKFGSQSSVTTINIGYTPGLQLNVKNGLAVYMEMGDISFSSLSGGGSSTNATSFNLGRALSIGIQKNFAGKKR